MSYGDSALIFSNRCETNRARLRYKTGRACRGLTRQPTGAEHPIVHRNHFWCPWPESNQHSLRNSILSRARLPIPPQGHPGRHVSV
jgi:hypothetical protein